MRVILPTFALVLVLLQQASCAPQSPERSPKPYRGDVTEILLDQKITDIHDEDFDNFLADEKSVQILVFCFLNYSKCPHPSIKNLLLQVRTLGVGAKCDTCSAAEQEDLNGKLYRFIYIFQNKYKKYWRQLLPNLGFILGTSDKRVELN